MKLNKEICKKCISKQAKDKQHCMCWPQPKRYNGRIFHILLRNNKIKITIETSVNCWEEDYYTETEEEIRYIPKDCYYYLEQMIS